jgi:hypothetical protein
VRINYADVNCPVQKGRKMTRKIERIYIHSTASAFGSFELVNQWHKERGFEIKDEQGRIYYIGYHYLVLNQYATAESLKLDVASFTDGLIVQGRPEELIGAQVKNDNAHSIGIAYVGFTPTSMQLWSMLGKCRELVKKYGLASGDVWGHHEYYLVHNQPVEKTCPNMNMTAFRNTLNLII